MDRWSSERKALANAVGFLRQDYYLYALHRRYDKARVFMRMNGGRTRRARTDERQRTRDIM